MKYARNPARAKRTGGPSRRRSEVWMKNMFSNASIDAARSAFSFEKNCLASSYIIQTERVPMTA